MPVRFRPDRNKYQADVLVRGIRKRPLFRTKKEAVDFEKHHRLDNGDAPRVTKHITLEAAIREYFDDLSVHKTSKKNDERYFNLMFHFMTGRRIRLLGEIRQKDLQAFQKWLQPVQSLGGEEVKKAWSNATVNRAFHTLHHFFETQFEWENLEVNPCARVKSLAETEPAIETVAPEVYGEVNERCEQWFKDCLEFIHEVGQRPSTIARLKFADLDFKKRIVIFTSMKGRDRKLKREERAMTEKAFAILLRKRNERPDLLQNDVVFRNAAGGPITAAWISRKGSRLFKKKVKGGAIKALRHTLASDLTAANVPTEIVRQALLHSSIRTTQRYAKSIKPKVVADAIERVRGLSLAPNVPESCMDIASGDIEAKEGKV